MERKQIYFGSVDKALNFIQTADTLNATMKLINESYIINAKSLLGVFSLDLSRPLMLEISGDDKSRSAAWLAIKEFCTNK